MSYLELIFLGLIQGIAEFLPISSDGHLTLAQAMLGRSLGTVEVNVVLHVGTLLSILLVFWRDLAALVHQPRVCLAICVATLPLLPVGLLLKDHIENLFTDPLWAGAGLLVTAVVLALFPCADSGDRSMENVRLRDALAIGLFQAVAPLPGVSRSGLTIFGGLLTGLSRQAAARFSFLIAVPALTGAAVLYSRKLMSEGAGGTASGPLLAGAIVAFVTGVVCLRWLLRLVHARRLWPFSLYCALLGGATVVWRLLAAV
jgi:undecaprenyl-diphosphatase